MCREDADRPAGFVHDRQMAEAAVANEPRAGGGIGVLVDGGHVGAADLAHRGRRWVEALGDHPIDHVTLGEDADQ